MEDWLKYLWHSQNISKSGNVKEGGVKLMTLFMDDPLDTIPLDYIQYPMQLTIGAKVKSQPIS